MNESPIPPESKPPSDSTPPPPPPPPFTPPPVAPEPIPTNTPATPPVPPAAVPPPSTPSTPPPPRPPVYTPPGGQPPKKSALPWVLGGCGCLTLLAIIATVIGISVYRAKQKVTEFKSDFKSALKSAEENQSKTSVAPTFTTTPSRRTETPPAPKAGWNNYVNVKENLPSGLQPNFVAFSFNYPKSFTLQPQSDVNFVKVEKYAAAGKGNTAENFAVGYAWFNPPDAESDELYNKLLDDLGQQLSGGFHNFREVRRIPETVDGVRSRAALFTADFNDAAKTMIYGKTIVVHPPGKKNGVTILILGTSLGRDVRSPDDLGTKGDTAEVLRSFKFL